MLKMGGKAYIRQSLIEGINNLAKDYRIDNDKWWTDPKTGERLVENQAQKLLLMVSEIAEAYEGRRKDVMDKHLPHRKAECVELADLFLRLMDYVGEYHPDFGEAVLEKIVYNSTRPDHSIAARLAPGGKKF